ncbi:MAG: toll/interleukin-1 receptor domain-containing protein [Longimicrobiaceae bacterium]
MPDSKPEEWDLFVSHASEDKEAFVAPLAIALREFGLRVWYDDFTLTVGDSLSRSIDRGLASSRFGIVVLSRHFLAKHWPEYELRGLVAREIGADKVILPIWHEVTRAEVLAFSPPLADKLAINTTGKSPLQVALEIIEVVKPDLYERIHRRLAFMERVAAARVSKVDPKTLQKAPIRHASLPEDLLSRIRLMRAVLLEVHPLTMQAWVDGFRRDLHPADEVRVWERIAAAYVEYCSFAMLSHEEREKTFSALLLLSLGVSRDEFEGRIAGLRPDAGEVLWGCFMSDKPIIEVAAEQHMDAMVQQPDEPEGQAHPDELPRELLRQLYEEATSGTRRNRDSGGGTRIPGD